MASGSRSLGGTCIIANLPDEFPCTVGIAPVTSADGAGVAAADGAGAGCSCAGIATRALSSVFGADMLLDCRSAGVGDISEGADGAGIAGLALFSAGAMKAGGGAAGSAEFSIGGVLPVSSSVIAILKVPSTITTTLTPTSSERIREDMLEGVVSPGRAIFAAALALSAPLSLAALAAALAAFSLRGAAAAACAARRAAAMKLDELTGSFGPGAISLITLSEAAIRSDGDDIRAAGRVPGSSGWSGGSSGAIAARGAAACGSRISLIARGGIGGASGSAAWNSRGAAAKVS